MNGPGGNGRVRAFQRVSGLLGRWRNTVYSAADHIWLLLLWAVSTPIFIHHLGADVFGVWILINAVIGLGGVLSLGFGEATVRYVAQYRGQDSLDDVRRIYNTTLSLYVLLGLASAVAIFAAAPAIARLAFKLSGPQASEAIVALRLAGVALFVTAYLKTFEAVVNGFERFDLTARVGMATRSFIILGNVALAVTGFSVSALIACAVVGLLGQAVALFTMARGKFVPGLGLFVRPDWRTLREIANFGIQTWLQIVAGAINTLADRFVVAAVLGPAAASVYVVCLQLAQQLHLILIRGLAFVMPATTRQAESRDEPSATLRYYSGGMTLVLMLAGAIAIPLYVLAPQVLSVWIGPDFAAAGADTLRIMAFYFAGWGAGVPINFLLNGAGRPGWNTISALAHSLVGLALVVVLLPQLGLPGAALGRLVALPTLFLTLWALHRHVLNGGGYWITSTTLLWLLVLAVVAGAIGSGPVVIPATPLAVVVAGTALAILGLCVALVPHAVTRRLRQATGPRS